MKNTFYQKNIENFPVIIHHKHACLIKNLFLCCKKENLANQDRVEVSTFSLLKIIYLERCIFCFGLIYYLSVSLSTFNICQKQHIPTLHTFNIAVHSKGKVNKVYFRKNIIFQKCQNFRMQKCKMTNFNHSKDIFLLEFLSSSQFLTSHEILRHFRPQSNFQSACVKWGVVGKIEGKYVTKTIMTLCPLHQYKF